MSEFQQMLEEARKRMARNMFTPKVKCSICFGTGQVSCYPSFQSACTGEVVKQPCQKCGGSGEHARW